MFLTAQESAVLTLSGLMGWIIGHQGSHLVALQTGRAELNLALAQIMGVETFAGILFLAWYAYMQEIVAALWLMAGSFIFGLLLVKTESMIGLTQRAWHISVSGIAFVPALLAMLVWLVLSPIST